MIKIVDAALDKVAQLNKKYCNGEKEILFFTDIGSIMRGKINGLAGKEKEVPLLNLTV